MCLKEIRCLSKYACSWALKFIQPWKHLEKCNQFSFNESPLTPPKLWRRQSAACSCNIQVISRIGKSSKNILTYNFIRGLLPPLTARSAARAEVFLSGHLPWHALVWRRHCSTELYSTLMIHCRLLCIFFH